MSSILTYGTSFPAITATVSAVKRFAQDAFRNESPPQYGEVRAKSVQSKLPGDRARPSICWPKLRVGEPGISGPDKPILSPIEIGIDFLYPEPPWKTHQIKGGRVP